MTLREWIEHFNNGDYDAADVHTQCEAGWYDWFCEDRELVAKTQCLGSLVKQLAQSPRVNQDTMYVFFKNNCPVCGELYDDFRFCDIESRDVIYCITPRDGYDVTPEDERAQVYGKENDFSEALVAGTWCDVAKWFGV